MNNPAIDAGSSKTSEELASLKQITMAVYALQALGSPAVGVTVTGYALYREAGELQVLWFLTGGVTAIAVIVAIIINYVKREDVAGTLYQSHFDWQIRTFWWGLLWGVVGMLSMLLVVGYVVLFVAWVWTIYRVVKGWLKLTEGKPVMPVPIA